MQAPRDEASTPDLSVVISCYFEERSIDEFYARLSRTLEELGRSYELVFVNDGSTDGTLAKLEGFFEADPRVRAVVDLFKNSGSAAAVTAGCRFARGARFVFLDSDLQLDPEELPQLLREFDKGCDVVSGYRAQRQDSWLRRLPSRLANAIMRRVSRSELRDFGCTFKIFDARLVRAFEPGPHKLLRPAYLVAAARDCAEVPVSHHPRRYGRSGWTFGKLFAYAMDNLVGLSTRPFQLLSLACFGVGLLLVLRILASPFLPWRILPEVTTGLLLNVLVFSLLVIVGVACVVGEYVIRSYGALQRHPAYVIRSVRQRD